MAKKWTRTHELQRQRILELLHQEARPFEDMSDEAKAARRALPRDEWMRTYLPHYVRCPFAPFHRELMRQANEPAMPFFVGVFRGAGKSVIDSLGDPLYFICNGVRKYMLYGSIVQGLAVDLMDFVRIELEHNARLRCDYGDLNVEGPEDAFVVEIPGVAQSVKLEAFGIGMSPRGRRHGAWRPDHFVGDDLEDAMLARSPKREQQLWDWLMDEVIPALEPDVWTCTISGTMYGPGCMLERAKEAAAKADPRGRPLAKVFLQAAVDAEGHSVWPERFGDEALDRIRAMIGLKNWNRNYALTADDPTKPFQPAWLLIYCAGGVDLMALDRVAALDPAIAKSEKACPRAGVLLGGDRKTGDRYAIEAWITHGSPMEMVRWLFEIYQRWSPRLIVVEENGGYALLKPLIDIERDRTGIILPVRYVSQSVSKEIRIETLAPFFEQGLWHFPDRPSAGMKTLMDQFTAYPDGFVDGPDVCAMADAHLPKRRRGASAGVGYRSLGRRTSYAGV